MKYVYLISSLITLLLINHSTQITINLPVSQLIIAKVTLSIDRLRQTLQYFNTKLQNKFDIYKRVHLTNQYLNQLKYAFSQYNNIVVGNANYVNGNQNFVFGNYNAVNGSNNWVFVSNFAGNINGDLIIQDWRVQLDKDQLILINPKFVISLLTQQRNKKLKEKYGKKQRTLCKWDAWAKPQDPKASQYWSKYQGFLDWKNQNKENKTTNLKTNLSGLSNITNKRLK